MNDTITLTGTIATDPRAVTTEAGLDIASFRLASTHRKFDRGANAWVDGETNWYTVTVFRTLAANVRESVHKGDRVLVTGRLRIRPWQNGERSGTTVEIDAETIGHDLRWGRSTYARSTTTITSGGTAGDSAQPTSPDDHPASDDLPASDEGAGASAAWSTAPLGADETTGPSATAPVPEVGSASVGAEAARAGEPPRILVPSAELEAPF
ncbi:single-stranded DNA-binding protein [Frigoribacterium faeni]|uniref:Single-stranded DNA-binding protein n=1 Tax=Frigoribacterium faeni TaxID=145483 RepID=A0A7W3JI99_9MICO|nr:single-stranded DNA-binding protein [Frigoribacterium faeni]MBA8813365.1 single-strand DNA-binding protein [Frigoribacterium faeni]BFF14593.1 hypothetical protein GCM10025699_58960 [Microbacterium flavescens]GEK83119.1 hypothetical protein FFA01_14280 [Frigoribacterium faeni]